jgi:ribosomal protein S18 acetylase RimI-like enzyme
VRPTLRLLSAQEIDEVAAEIERAYADDIERDAGFTREAAQRKAAAEIPRVLGDGANWLYALEADGERVGRLWVGERDLDDGRVLWIWEVFVDERFRGRGYGRAAMELAEEEARERGLATVALNVFGRNDVARGLYRSLGYDEVAVAMRKSVA